MSCLRQFNHMARVTTRACRLVLLWAGLGMGGLSIAHAQLPDVQRYGDVDYLTGGFGHDESSAIKDVMADYPLVLTFSSSDGGGRAAYVSRVQVVIRDTNDATWLNVESQGPFLLARLPAGKYEVFATYKNQTRSKTITLTEGQSTRAVFDWPREANAAQDSGPSATQSGAAAPDADEPSLFKPGSVPGLDGTHVRQPSQGSD